MYPQPAPTSSPRQYQTFVLAPQKSSRRRKELPLKFFHRIFGIMQMMMGGLMFALKLTTLNAVVPFSISSGIYCGVLAFVTGFLSFLSAKLDSFLLIIPCMILNIVAAFAWTIGLRFAAIQVLLSFEVLYSNPKAPAKYGYGESFLMFFFCFLEFILTVFHTCLICCSLCTCCRQNATSADDAMTALSNSQDIFPLEDASMPHKGTLTPEEESSDPLQLDDEDFQFKEDHFLD